MYVKGKSKICLSLLVNAHSRLSVLQLQKGCVTQEETVLCFKSQTNGDQFSVAEINAHVGLIFESVISPSISATGQIKLQVNREVVGNDEKFVNCILSVLQNKFSGSDYPQVAEFRREAQSYLKRLAELNGEVTPAAMVESDTVALSVQASAAPVSPPLTPITSDTAPDFFGSKTATNSSLLTHVPMSTSPLPAGTGNNSSLPSSVGQIEYDGPPEHKYAPARVEFERAEPIVRLLAQVRKVGMDILFPLSTHDKVSCCKMWQITFVWFVNIRPFWQHHVNISFVVLCI